MSRLDAIGILGIRSFSPEVAVYVQFQSGCTIFVGPNGSGKTTIIEAIKYACTGDMPPNSKNGAFIYDAKASGRSSVKAQVRLKFMNRNQTEFICTRSLELSQKGSGSSMKTLDSSLKQKNPETGEVISVNSRCSDINYLMASHLGTSKAMMESVMFCHQEESNWPLSESSILKKKFDALFDTAKHVKTLKGLKETKKTYKENGQAEKIELEGLKANKKYAEKLKATLDDLSKALEDKQESLAAIDKQLATTDENLASFRKKYRSVEEVETRYAQLIHEKDLLIKNITEISRHLKETSESDQELERMLRNYSEESKSRQRAKEDAENEMKDLNQALDTKKANLSSLMSDITRLQVAEEANSVRVQHRIDLIKSLDKELHLGVSTPLDSDDATAKLMDMISTSHDSLKGLKIKAREEESALRDAIHSIKSEQVSLQKSVQESKMKRDQNDAAIQNLQTQLNAIQDTQDTIREAKESLSKEEELLRALRTRIDSENSDSRVNSLKKKLAQIEDQEAALKKEILLMSQDKELRSKISFKRTNMEEKQKLADTIFEQNKQVLKKYIGCVPTQEDLESELSEKLCENQKRLQSLSEKQSKDNQRVSEATTKISMAKENLAKMEIEAKNIEELIESTCTEKSLSEKIITLDKTVLNLERSIAVCQYEQRLYENLFKEAKEDGTCTICSTHMKGGHLAAVIERHEKSQEKISLQLNNLQRTINLQKAEQDKLKFIKGPSYQLDSLKKDKIPPLRASLESYMLQKSAADKDLAKTSKSRLDVEKYIERIKFLLKQAETMTHHLKEAKSIGSEIASLESQLKHATSNRTITDCQEELGNLSEVGKSLQKSIVELMEDKSRVLNEYHAAERDIISIREKVARLEEAIKKKENITNELEMATRNKQKLHSVVQDMKSRLAPLMDKFHKKSALLEKTLADNGKEQETLEYRIIQIKQALSKLEGMNQEIKVHQERGLKSQLKKLLGTKASIDSDIDNISKAYQRKGVILRNLEDQLSDQIRAERELNDQIQYRKYKAELRECESKLSGMGEQGLTDQKNAIQQKIRHLEKTHSHFKEERGNLRGTIGQIEEQKSRCVKELEGPYKDAAINCTHMSQRVMRTERIIAENERLMTTLERAIAMSHSDMMDELNNIIKELWVNTYRGGDIEYIAIRTDLENGGSGGVAGRTFNYRVVMAKGGEEINMRGRFSAGQKAMVSIIIRLALADIFCSGCNIIALDEPTTNLDQDNVKSLASGIANLVKSRLQQKSFQLILITHDEEFVNILASEGLADSFYRVYKDANHYSTVRSQRSREEE